jgi:hypothetical protein
MTLDNFPQLALSVAPGIGVALFSLIHTIRQSRGSYFLTSATGLFKLHDELAERGALNDRTSSENSERAHVELLALMEREARANSYMFVRSVARLERPGAFISSSLLIAYGGALTASAIASLSQIGAHVGSKGSDALVSAAVLATFGLPFLAAGLVRFWRRIQTRRIRKQIGLRDASTLEGMKAEVRQLAIAFRHLRTSAHPRPPLAR